MANAGERNVVDQRSLEGTKKAPIRRFLETNFSNHYRLSLSDARTKIRSDKQKHSYLITALDIRILRLEQRWTIGYVTTYDVTSIEDIVAYKTAIYLTELQDVDPKNFDLGYHLLPTSI